MDKNKPLASTFQEVCERFDMSDVFYILGAFFLNFAVFQINDIAMYFFLGVQLLLAGLAYGRH
jgi:hypothetical protein